MSWLDRLIRANRMLLLVQKRKSPEFRQGFFCLLAVLLNRGAIALSAA
ncbi:hypothetical protein FSO04_44475 [Paraburkholderia madseniana]|uniref:Uncharacterized protein n=1 Tax=Paraburkholderia madseniana TaxID=2599607 RepID=A0A6N6VZ24_9BURK|nr:hypothetical protein [Paraburkholderia madseniana]KAE8753563.1 hypothetical protein FSO04_44475 [Paraburkholderia madseniana]